MCAAATTLAFVMPGQGSQRVGMLDALPASALRDSLLDCAESLTGRALRTIASDGPDALLADTLAAQPLLYVADVLWATALGRAGVTPAVVAGHSLGELAALAFAGAFPVETGLELVCERARLMADATATTPGTMAAVLGMDGGTVADLVGGLSGVWLANDNAPGQVVLSGTHEGIEAATRELVAAGARKVVPLSVSGAFHSPLMARAAEAFASVLAGVDFADTDVPVISNAEPTATTRGVELRDRLVAQMASPVRWTETMESLRASGASLVVESGPGAVLAGLARRAGLDTLAVETAGIDGIVEVTRA